MSTSSAAAALAFVRKACPSGVWSQGVKMVREGAVSIGEASDSEPTFRVRERGRAIAPTVTLFVADEEWDCDCGTKAPICNHVAAAAIAWAAPKEQALAEPGVSAASDEPARASGQAAAPAVASSSDASTPLEARATAPGLAARREPAARPPAARREAPRAAPALASSSATLAYALTIAHGALALERFVVLADGTRSRLALSLADRIARGIREPDLEPTHDDLAVDRVFMKRLRGDVPLGELRAVLDALSRARAVTLDGVPVRTSGELVVPEVRIVDGPQSGVVLSIVSPPGVTVKSLGTAIVGGVLRPLAETARFGFRFEKLPIDRPIAREELGTLAADVLPELEKTMVVDIRTKRVPRREQRMLPRVEFELTHELGALNVLPLLVYGDPPVARVDAGKLILLPSSNGEAALAPARDEARERSLAQRLRDELSLVPGRRVRYDGRDASVFAAKLERFTIAEPRSTTHGEATRRRELVPRVIPDGEVFDIAFELETEDRELGEKVVRRASAADVARAYREGLGIVALEGGGFAHLPTEFLEKHAQALFDLVAARAETGGATRAALPVLLDVAEDLGLDVPNIAEIVGPLLADFDGIPHAPLPPALTAELRPYQKRGADWLTFLGKSGMGGVLADDMGLGKTVQMLASIRTPALVVCPRSVVHNWASEARKFRPDLSVRVYEGQGRSLTELADVTLMTYAILRNDVEEVERVEFETAILDEAQAIKNPDSQSARAAFRIKSKSRFVMTGTPVENHLLDLWSLMRFSNPGLLGTRADFIDRFAEPVASGTAPDAAARLRKRVKPFLLRRTKGEVLPDLPPRIDSVLYAELEPHERELYKAILAATRREIMERLGAGDSVLAMLEALLRLRQASCHLGLLPGRSDTRSAKLDRLMDAINELAGEGHKALVFSQWTSLLDKIEPYLDEAKLGFVRLDGSTRDRESVVNKFQDPGGPPVMLLSLKAGGVGLNLTAADHVFLCDPWWNPAVEEQAADRAHRIGQDKPVNVYRMVAKDTVEERILALQEKKRAIAATVTNGGGSAGGITREELLSLLEDV